MAAPVGGVDLLSGGLDSLLDIGGPTSASPAPTQMNSNPMGGGMMDLLGGALNTPAAAPPQQPQDQNLSALGNLGIFGGAPEAAAPKNNKTMYCNPQQCMGLELMGEIVLRGGKVRF